MNYDNVNGGVARYHILNNRLTECEVHQQVLPESGVTSAEHNKQIIDMESNDDIPKYLYIESIVIFVVVNLRRESLSIVIIMYHLELTPKLNDPLVRSSRCTQSSCFKTMR
jgi:hypothetical protein